MDIGHTTSPLGSGGMRSKVVAAEMATAAGIPAVICSGLSDTALGTVLEGGAAGTRFPAQQARYSSFKLWLRYAKPSHGTVVIDAGAARALREGASRRATPSTWPRVRPSSARGSPTTRPASCVR
jgi:glutamate 5-kinase